MTIPMQRADPQKKVRILHTKDLNALGKIFRGCSVSPATMETYSGPQILFESVPVVQKKRPIVNSRKSRLNDTSDNTQKATGIARSKV